MTEPTPAAISIGLVSHTNAGKTTLARTLLQRDVGEVRDAPHVTEFSSEHVLLRSASGCELRLWDTPGFGDSVRLARRMRQAGQPLGWLLSEVWDRWRDRPFWGTQQALRQVREQADVVLYLVNAAESPEAAGYVEPEMALLGWVGKPVIVLLNQLGAPRAAAEEAADVERWRRHLAALAAQAGSSVAVSVLPMDAFARCWVQELTLLRAIEAALPAPQRAAMAALRTQWAQQRLATFNASMQVLAESLGRSASARVAVGDSAGLRQRLRRLGSSLTPMLSGQRSAGNRGGDKGDSNASGDDPAALAQQALAAALDADVRASTAQLIALHGLEGRAQGEILARVATHFELRRRVDEGQASVVGGMLSGALVGLKADVATGGLTLGGGLLAGGLIGALSAAGLARGINVMRGGGPAFVGWSAEAMAPMLDAALLRYLAVAHFGRGRGEWAQGEAPAHWRSVVTDAWAPQQPALAVLWATRSAQFNNPGDAERLGSALQPLLAAAARSALERLYPGTWPEVETTLNPAAKAESAP